jgi:hypothetical protein
MPPIGYVVQSVSLSTNQTILECSKDRIKYIPHNIQARHYQTGETCELKGVFNRKKQEYHYKWVNQKGERVSF